MISRSNLALILTYSVFVSLLIAPNCVVFGANTQSAIVYIDPAITNVSRVGTSFTVNVSIADVSNLYGYEFQLFYNSEAMNGTSSASDLQGPFLESGGTTDFFVTNFTDTYNSTFGILWVECTLTGQISGVSGSGTLVSVSFKSVGLGNSLNMSLEGVKLSDNNAKPIAYQVTDGTVTIVPEFASPTLIFVMIIVPLVVVAVIKKERSRLRSWKLAS